MRLAAVLISSLVAITVAVVIPSTNDPRSVVQSPANVRQAVVEDVRVQYVTSKDGVKVYSEGVGRKSAPHVILVPGFAAAHIVFDPLWNDPVLRENLYMVRYDPRGHGLTDKPIDSASYNSSRYAEDVDAVVKAYDLKKPFFAGWSLAGTIAVDIAAYYPSPLPFSGFISFAGLPYMGVTSTVVTDLLQSILPGFMDNSNSTNALQSHIDLIGTQSSKGTDIPYDIFSSWVGAAGYIKPLSAVQIISRTQNPTRLLAEGAKGWPFMLLWGDKDRGVKLEPIEQFMQPFITQETHVIPGAGHLVFYDAEPQVASELLRFTHVFYNHVY